MRLGLGNRVVSTGCCGRMNRSMTNGLTYKRTQFVLDWSKSGMTGRIESDSMNIEKIRREAMGLPYNYVICFGVTKRCRAGAPPAERCRD